MIKENVSKTDFYTRIGMPIRVMNGASVHEHAQECCNVPDMGRFGID